MSSTRAFAFSLLALALCLAAAGRDETTNGGGSSAPAILVAMRSASGGDDWSAIKSLHLVMTTTGGGETAHGERWEDVATGRYVEREAWPTHYYIDGFDGVTPWHQGRSGIAYALGDVDAALVAEAWVDRATHLLARTDEQQAEDRLVTTYADYRPVQGLMLPFSIRVGDGEDPSYDQVETVLSVDVNPAISDAQFALPARPPSDVTFPPGRDAVDVPFRLTADDRILVPLTIDGRRTVEAEFDSGGSLILQPATLAALGITAEGREKQGGGGEGSSTAGTGRLAGIALGGSTVRDVGFHSRALDPDHPDYALIGLEVLQRFTVRLDFDRGVMTLTRPGAFSYDGAGAIVPFHFQDNQPEVHGSVDGIAGLFTIDTGDAGSLLLIAPFARRYGLVARYRADLPYDGRAITATHGVFARRRVGTVAFDGPDGRPVAEAHDPVTRISLQHAGFDANRDVSANIGLGILKRFNVTFDYLRQRIILEPNRLHDQRDVFNRAGLRLQREGAAWTVTAVYAGTPAADAGLHPGDTILRIDGGAADALDTEALWAKLEGPLGTEVHLRLRPSAGTERDEVLTLRDLL